MSFLNGNIKVKESAGARLFPLQAYEAVTASYEPGDPIGYGPTPADAINDLIELIHLHLEYIDNANPQQRPS